MPDVQTASPGVPSTPKSVITGIGWPGLPSPPGAVALALQFQLEYSQWFSSEQLEALQLGQLQRLFQHVHAHNPFYRQRLDHAGVDPGIPLTMEIFRQLPLLRREDIQSAGPALFSEQTPRDHGRPLSGKTSGSSGRPIEFRSNDLCQLFWRAITLREHLWHGRHLQGKLAVIRARVESGERRGWGPATDEAFDTGASATLDIQVDVEQQARWLEAQDPDYLLSYPSNLAALARLAQAGRLRLGRLRQLRTLGEILDPQTRSLCQEAFGVPIADMYSASEAGYIALQCPHHAHYHVQSETMLVEVLDADGHPCGPGEVGEVVLTVLHNFAMPFIRYAIGDYAEVGEACPCGRGLPVLRRVIGRVRNMMCFPDGRRHWPVLDYRAYGQVMPISQLRLIQRAPDRIDVELVTPQRPDSQQESRLAEAIQRSLGFPFKLTFHYLESIPRSAGGKFEDFISDLA